MKRLILCLAPVLVLLAGNDRLAGAAPPYPSKTIELIIPMLPGAAGDITGRILVEELNKELGGQVVVINKPGGNFTLGTDQVVRSKKDGYTLAYTNSPAIVYARAMDPGTVPYDPDKDLEPLGLHVYFPQAIVVSAKSPWKTFNELVEHAKRNPGALRCASPGTGTASTFVLELVKKAAGIQVTELPTKGGQLLPQMLLGGHTEMAVGIVSLFASQVQAGELRFLFMTRKLAEFPGVPIFSEIGYKNDPPSGWFGLYGPAGLPEDVKKVLVPAIKKAVESPAARAKLEKLYYVVDYKSPEEFSKLTREEYNIVAPLAKELGITGRPH
jgi:tripartite-type tricarboxylate transporter receptor subunit TctC